MDAKGEQTAFVYMTYIQETPERVWQGLTDPAVMKRYWRHQKAGPKTFHSEEFGPVCIWRSQTRTPVRRAGHHRGNRGRCEPRR